MKLLNDCFEWAVTERGKRLYVMHIHQRVA